jgi:tetratricopeptide (TPR) repeat protein
VELLIWLSRCQYAAGQSQQALQGIQVALEAAEQLCKTHASLTSIQVELGCMFERERQFESAENAYRKALALSTHNLEDELLYSYTAFIFFCLKRVLCKQWKLTEIQRLFKAELQFVIAASDCDQVKMRRLLDAFDFYRAQKVCPDIEHKLTIAEELLTQTGYLKKTPYVVHKRGPASMPVTTATFTTNQQVDRKPFCGEWGVIRMNQAS